MCANFVFSMLVERFIGRPFNAPKNLRGIYAIVPKNFSFVLEAQLGFRNVNLT